MCVCVCVRARVCRFMAWTNPQALHAAVFASELCLKVQFKQYISHRCQCVVLFVVVQNSSCQFFETLVRQSCSGKVLPPSVFGKVVSLVDLADALGVGAPHFLVSPWQPALGSRVEGLLGPKFLNFKPSCG